MHRTRLAAPAALFLGVSTVLAQQEPPQPTPPPPAEQPQDQPPPADAAQPAEPAAPPRPLLVGDKAPALSVESWVKGDPLTGFEKNRVYVVEYWATWCGPCIQTIPHLTKLQETYKDKGLTIAGFSSANFRGDSLEAVTEFVTQRGDEMGYTVGFDADGSMSRDWMEAAQQQSIPTAFVVNREGLVAWVGSPFEIDQPLKEIVEGTYDLAAATARAEHLWDLQQKVPPLYEKMVEQWQSGDRAAAFETLEQIVDLDPKELGNFSIMRFRLIVVEMGDTPAAYAYLRDVAEKKLWDAPEMLAGAAMTILEDPQIPEKDLPYALKLAERASEVKEGKDAPILDVLGRAQAANGKYAEAVVTQTKAVEAAEIDEMKADFQVRLDEYKRLADQGG